MLPDENQTPDLDDQNESTQNQEEENTETKDVKEQDNQEDDQEEEFNKDGAEVVATPIEENAAVQKRINKLTAQLKEAKEEAEFYRTEIEKKEAEIERYYDGPVYKGKPVYELTDKEFQEAIRAVKNRTDIDAEQKLQTIDSAIEARDKYLEKMGPLIETKNKVNEREQQIWDREMTEVRHILLDKEHGNPELEKYVAKITERWNKDLENSFLVQRLQKGGVEAKLKHAIKIINEMGLDVVAETETYRKERPSLGAPVGAGKGSKTAKTAGKPLTYSREQIAQMTPEDYKKHREAIFKANREGRIKR